MYKGDPVAAWVCGNETYKPLETVKNAQIEGKTFVPLAEKTYAKAPAAFDASLGERIYFNNFAGLATGLADLTVLDAGKPLLIDGSYYVKGENLYTISDSYGAMVSGMEIASANGIGKRLTYADGTPLKGKITLVYQAYNADPSAFTMFNVADAPVFGTDEWIGYRAQGVFNRAVCFACLHSLRRRDLLQLGQTRKRLQCGEKGDCRRYGLCG